MKAYLFLLLLCVILARTDDTEPTNSPATPDEVEPEYEIPKPQGVRFLETFQDDDWESRWQRSSKEKFAGGEWKVGQVTPASSFKIEKGLIVVKPAQHHAISTKLAKPIGGELGKDLVIQYEVRFHQAHQCGGAYIKLLTAAKDFKTTEFDNESPYTIMFGPDKCGTSDRVHFIIRHQSPTTKKWEEKHLRAPPTIISDKLTHLYTLVIRHDDTFEVLIDQKSVKKGSLFDSFDPAIDPPKEIDDPTDFKPADWVDEEKIKDPDASKPDDWDESAPATIPDESAVKPSKWCDDCPKQVPDPEAAKPDDWDDELDGEYVAPLVDNPVCDDVGCGTWVRPSKANPNYKGKWVHPLIHNPDYKGVWKARQIPNPDYFHDEHPHQLSPIGAIGFELWTMQDDIEFDNILLDTSEEAANQFASATWAKKHAYEKAKVGDYSKSGGGGYFDDIVNTVSEFVAEKPGVFVAIMVGILTLVIVLIYFCCTSSPAPQQERRREAKATTEQKQPVETKSEAKATPKSEPEKPAEKEEQEVTKDVVKRKPKKAS